MSVSKLILSLVFVATKHSVVYSSIHFDEVEYYDPNKTLDESTSNGFVCAHLGEECQISAQCCGVATCALSSWSETPLCLVPGYKHDQRFKKRFFSLHNLRPEDIRYIRDSYNTSQYDFLLSDLTFSSPPLDNVADITVVNTTDTGGIEVSFSDIGIKNMDNSTLPKNMAGNSQMIRASSELDHENRTLFLANENLDNNSNIFTVSVSHPHLTEYGSVNKEFSTNSSVNSELNFKNHFMFLLMNKTLTMSDSKLNLKEYNDQVNDTDRFRKIVKQLRDKMREINEMEKNLCSTTENSTVIVTNCRETNSATKQMNNTTRKMSKWNVVKKFFYHEKKNDISHNYSSKDNYLKKIVDEMTQKEMFTTKSQEIHSKHPEKPNEKAEFTKLIEDVAKIEDIIDSDRTIKTFHGSKDANDEGLFDFYNINIPLASFGGNREKTGWLNNSLESVFQDISDTINMMMKNKYDSGKNYLEVHKEQPANYDDSQQYSNISKKTPNENSRRISNKTHFWDKIWKIPHNLSAEVERSFKKIFFSKDKLNPTKKQNKSISLNEYFLLNLNSKTPQEATIKTIQTEQTDKNSEYLSYLSSSESESSSAELYNNSYVFMVHKEHLEEPLKLSSWKKMMNIFHRDKMVPLSIDINDRDFPTKIICKSENSPSKIESESDPGNVQVSKIIRLPEYLMPEALDERQKSETNWIFDDSENLEDRTIEEQKSSNSSLFFFFK